jgi:hydrogenase maturation protein HypF
MQEFSMCHYCHEEYTSMKDRRYHAQTLSCPRCGPQVTLYNTEGDEVDVEDPIQQFSYLLDNGAIGVMKSWGGMHLCCNLEELPRFRTWYNRPQKPFAIMVRNITAAKRFGKISHFDQELLSSSSRPIVAIQKTIEDDRISPGLNTVGVFLPYTGLHHILFSYLQSDAVLMTSANIPGEPMVTDNNDAFSLKADYYLLHNRDIPNRADDSVIKTWKNRTFFLRKSRGHVPDPLPIPHKQNVIAVGAGEHLNAAVSSQGQLFLTQYIGNTKYYPVVEFLEESIQHLITLSMTTHQVDAVAMDLHPGYGSRIVAQRLAEQYGVQPVEVQHHFAHAVSLLVEHNRDYGIVLALDGLGYGDDGTLWGGEILDSHLDSYTRIGHLEPFPLLGGDQATYDPKRLVYSLFKTDKYTQYFSDEELPVLEKLMAKSPRSSSFGRFLDALSCYLEICMTRTYDGEPAMKLEPFLAQGKKAYDFRCETHKEKIKILDLFQELISINPRKLSYQQKADVVYSMVKSVVDAMVDMACDSAQSQSCKFIGVTGGVSYNIPIVNMVDKRVKHHGLELVVHNKVPNGDGGIAVGQNVRAGVNYTK